MGRSGDEIAGEDLRKNKFTKEKTVRIVGEADATSVAETRYRGRRLALDGVVESISTGVFGGATAHLRTSNMFMPVDAELSRQDTARLVRNRPASDVVPR